MTWSTRYAAGLPSGRPTCKNCGMMDDGTNTVISNGKCRDDKVCQERQDAKEHGNLIVTEQPKKKRTPPYIDRQGMSACAHEDCQKEGKRFPATSMSWFPSPYPTPFCSDHFMFASNSKMDFNSWKNRYRRR